jgi:hypothetical protein
MAEVCIEVGHQMCGGMIFKLPECRNNALSARFDERIHNVGGSLLADWPYARIASRECYKTGIEAKVSDFTYLQETIIGVWLLWGENESRAIWVLGIDVSVKRKMDDLVLVERNS